MDEVNTTGGAVHGVPVLTPAQRRTLVTLLLLALSLLGCPRAQAGSCSLARLPDLPVTMSDLRPLVHAQLNGRDALFLADSGAFFDLVTPAAVSEFQLRVENAPEGMTVQGIGGSERAQLARAKTFTLLGHTVANVPFFVAGSDLGGGAVGVLGANVFAMADVEYDLANGVIRLIRPKDCKDTPLAYWASTDQKSYSAIDIAFGTKLVPHIRSQAYLNGTKIRVLFDTGASTSLLTFAAAKRAGITPTSPGVQPSGSIYGIGHRVTQTWIAPVASFKIGDEEIAHTRLRFGDIEELYTDMLIGADFFLSHRIYVANSQHKLYFTYNGGPVFNLTTTPAAPAAAPAAAAVEAAEPADTRLDTPTDAAGYARRGAASAARHDYPSGLADLSRAVELAPTESSYVYARGIAYWDNQQADLALADFDQALKLKPDNVDALIARAALRPYRDQPAQTIVPDLEAADTAAPTSADVHLRIGSLYEAAELPAAALVQYSKWIDSHPREDLRMPGALNSRCWARALTGQALELALADCNAALRLKSNTPSFLGSRGLVYLRHNKFDEAIADYNAALRRDPKIAWSLYGRGLAELRTGNSAPGHADITAATALAPKIAERAARFGLGP